MRSSHGLWRLHHAAQTRAAKDDFLRLANTAINSGRVALVKQHMYPEGAGWRVIDKHLERLAKSLGIVDLAAELGRD